MPYSESCFSYMLIQRFHIVRIEKRRPRIAATCCCTWPGPSTGIVSRERRAARPESDTVSITTASKPSSSLRRPASAM